ncbi:lipoate-protein ligase A [Bacteroides luti]|uniref:Lipoate-protein ligase A n=1 Tax=Bacteroides luti TaxID=1297750 RepID=A0A1M4Y2P1_9BACE|nr:lipoate--protein ligase family protein [Bacteroides luti]SHE99949.1 lipoate-protein ligase A [Bacteroides luti]
MLCINNPYTDAWFNLAAEEYFLHSFQENVFMLWQNEPSVIIGKHQNVWAEVNMDFVRDHRIKVVRRYSGGGAVYHDAGNLNFTFIENSDNADFNKYLIQIQKFLREIGINAEADERRGLNIDGLKISGSAQCIHKKRVMYHATLLYSTDLLSLNAALTSLPTQQNDVTSPRLLYVKSVRSPVTNIKEYVPDNMQISNLKELIMNYFLKNETNNKIYIFSEKDLSAIKQLSRNKYSTSDWNFNASYLK